MWRANLASGVVKVDLVSCPDTRGSLQLNSHSETHVPCPDQNLHILTKVKVKATTCCSSKNCLSHCKLGANLIVPHKVGKVLVCGFKLLLKQFLVSKRFTAIKQMISLKYKWLQEDKLAYNSLFFLQTVLERDYMKDNEVCPSQIQIQT